MPSKSSAMIRLTIEESLWLTASAQARLDHPEIDLVTARGDIRDLRRCEAGFPGAG